MDLSPAIAWLVPLAGIGFSALYGARGAADQRESFWGRAFVMALFLGIALTFAQSALHSLCVEAMHLCASRGDANISYWFQSFFAIPVFWLVAAGAWQVKR
ncbi:hypothetical protein [Caldimonas sp. KR1-144]|uniref:hypothetical protein n=1 Tax=Caldimonas sp. KR1-144 TaxID=3400911 RepID=UPI003C01EE46